MKGTAERRVSVERILDATQVIDPRFLKTPQVEVSSMNSELQLQLHLKLEVFNPIRSFKGRGADYFVASQRSSGQLVCASSGNFGQGLAWACKMRGLTLTVYTAESANPAKIARMRELGANVVAKGEDFDEAKLAGVEFAAKEGAHFIEDGRDLAVTEGAGTIGVELSSLQLDAVVLPVGNGALINGVGAWFRHNSPTTKIYGVCAVGAPSMERSWRAERVIATTRADTIADGIAIRLPVAEAVDDMRSYVDDVVLVEDAEIVSAMRFLHRGIGVACEPSGAVGLAGVLAMRERLKAAQVATVVTGGNLTVEQMRQYLGTETS